MRLIIDTDAGTDDAQAIMLALTHPGVTVEAITTVTGNIHVDKVVPNVLSVLELLHKNVPVYRGAERPLIADWTPEEKVHGRDGLGDWAERPVCTRRAESEHAVQALLRLVNAAPGEYTLVALGPLTNIALAIQLDPSFPAKIKQFVFMGGTIQAMGNTINPTAEWNIFCDPEAAFITLRAFPLATMLSWETTMQHPMPWEQFNNLTQIQSAAARFMTATSRLTAEFLRSYQYAGYLLPDPLAMAVTLQPDLVRKSADHYVTVELSGTYTRGQTVIEYLPRPGHQPNVRIVQELNINSVYELFKRALSG
ncbi:MAG TPA: nucleoside hydrolase [Phototrophicaceae bacterium]|nr:nucleoside hydrolase [Phototrophicaceae bacterium]